MSGHFFTSKAHAAQSGVEGGVADRFLLDLREGRISSPNPVSALSSFKSLIAAFGKGTRWTRRIFVRSAGIAHICFQNQIHPTWPIVTHQGEDRAAQEAEALIASSFALKPLQRSQQSSKFTRVSNCSVGFLHGAR